MSIRLARAWARTAAWLIALTIALANVPFCAFAEDTPYETIRDVTYLERGETALRADVYRPRGDGPFPGVLCIHGGAWAAGNKNQMATIAEMLAGKGYTAVAISYRLAPQHKFPAQIEDCREGLQWLRENTKTCKTDARRLAVWGYSAGGHLAALLAVSSTGLRAAVVGGAPCDFRNMPLGSQQLAFWLGGSRRELPEVYKAASPAAQVSDRTPPLFFYHGETDNLVPIAQPTAMADLLKKANVPATVYAVPQAGHIAAFLNRDAMAETVKFLDKYVRTATVPEAQQ